MITDNDAFNMLGARTVIDSVVQTPQLDHDRVKAIAAKANRFPEPKSAFAEAVGDIIGWVFIAALVISFVSNHFRF